MASKWDYIPKLKAYKKFSKLQFHVVATDDHRRAYLCDCMRFIKLGKGKYIMPRERKGLKVRQLNKYSLK